MATNNWTRHLLWVVLFLTFFGLLGTSLAQTEGGVLKIAVTTGPPTLDPHFSPSRATGDIAINVFEGLVGFDKDFSVRPQLAESWEVSDDGLTYTFHLRPGVVFHNGREVNADDVKASLERILEISPSKSRLQDIESIEVVDDRTVRLHLSQPNGPLLQTLATPTVSILPAEAIEGKPGGEAELIGTGPYEVAEWLPDRYVRLTRFDDYVPREGEPGGSTGMREACVAEVQFIPVPEDSSRATGLQTGEYHIADFLPYGAGRRLQQTPEIEILEVQQHMMPFMYFNHAEERITSDMEMRQAIQAALNNEEMMAVASEGYGSLNPSYYFGVWATDEGSELYNQQDLEKARRLMEEAGYDGQPITIVTNTGYDVMYRSALMVERQLQEAGFDTDLQVYDWPGSLAVRSDGNWDLFFSGHLLQEDPSIIEFHLQPATSPFAYDDPQVSELFSEGRKASDQEQRQEIYAELQDYLYDTAAWVKLFDQNIFQGHTEQRRRVSSLALHACL